MHTANLFVRTAGKVGKSGTAYKYSEIMKIKFSSLSHSISQILTFVQMFYVLKMYGFWYGIGMKYGLTGPICIDSDCKVARIMDH